ncbi:MAG TPA: DNA polymerase IV, partial [Kofleriaceae bacterium]|nr:DNA polymerase IV [Kofleriaceae bacterium]
MTARAILHVDLDAFFAAVEQRDDPSLRGKPVLVGGSRERGVVAAASYEARRYGVHSAMPMARALRLCPQAIVVAHRFERYTDASHQFFTILGDYSPLVESLSLDEAFVDVTASRRLLGDEVAIARDIKRRV